MAGLLGWLGSYGWRVVRGKMTYHQQLANYQKAVLQKKLAEMSPAEIAQLLQETSECKESL
jgi:DNA-directed RNA polymerase specialized sigma24 family protein